MILSSTNNISNKFDQEKIEELLNNPEVQEGLKKLTEGAKTTQQKTSSLGSRLWNTGKSFLGKTCRGVNSVANKVVTPRNVVLLTVAVNSQEVMSGPWTQIVCMGLLNAAVATCPAIPVTCPYSLWLLANYWTVMSACEVTGFLPTP